MATLPIIETLKSKIEGLILLNKTLRQENTKLKAANEKLKNQNKTLTAQLDDSKQKINLLELSKGFTAGGADNKQAKARVNQLMREVDKCIAMVQGQE